MRSLWVKLVSAFAGVILLGIVVNSLLINQLTQSQFSQYVTTTGQAWAARLAPSLASYYAQNGTWQGVDQYLGNSSSMMMGGTGETTSPSERMGPGMMGDNGMWNGGMQDWMGSSSMMGDMWGIMDVRLILADNQGKVIADTAQTAVNQQLSANDLQAGIPLQVNSQPVGTLLAVSSTPASNSISANFLNAVQRTTWITGLMTGILGLLLGFFLFRQIVSPIRTVTEAASNIANGKLHQRVPVKSNDEVGTLARTFNQMADSLERDQHLRQSMIADIAHELRTPVTILQANLEGMLDGVLPSSPEEIASLRDEVDLLSRLIADLRLLSLAEAGQLKLEKTMVPARRIVELAIEGFQMQAAEQKVNLVTDVADGLPPVFVDADRMNMVLRNLISNALRYTPENGEIVVHASQKDGEAILNVTDTGRGIAVEDLPYVFDRFYRADKSRSRSSGGSGIGLAIVKQLVEAHGGKVLVKSPVYSNSVQEKGGTCFTIQMPYSDI